MRAKNRKPWHVNPVLSAFLLLCISVLNVHVSTGWTKDGGVKVDEKSREKKDTEPESKKSSTSSTLLYSGIGVAAVAAVAAVAGGAGGSSDSDEATPAATTTTTTTTTTKPTTTTTKPKIKKPSDNNPAGSKPVGADIGGNNWRGIIDLVGAQGENITASIYQNGTYVVITTSSHQKYGQKLVGNIAADGFMKLYDQRTGQDWTTHYGNATSKKIDIYDFVDNNYDDLDRILLQR